MHTGGFVTYVMNQIIYALDSYAASVRVLVES